MSHLSTVPLEFIEIGHLAAWLAMGVALFQGLLPLFAGILGKDVVQRLAPRCAGLVFTLLLLGAISLWWAFLHDDFSVRYVAQHSNSQLPTLYKFTGFWGGHEGSLYLWVFILSAYTAALTLWGRRRLGSHLPQVLAVQGWLTVGFLGLVLFLSSPFARLFPAPLDGRDLNPLLQDPGMAIHPPMLYLGYVGFSVPYALVMAALVSGWRESDWLPLARRWALIGWGFLSVGIMLGGWWAYYELGWGGYWAWDPVENASFMPWLTGTALLHSLMVQENRRQLRVWSLFLVITTFSLSLLGTFLVRSGILSSVHAFAVDPGRGAYILLFLGTVLVVSFGLFLRHAGDSEGPGLPIGRGGRASFLLVNNLLFTVASASVLLGTLYPLFLDLTMSEKITVAAPYFNSVVVPMLMAALLIMAFAPGLPWRRLDLKLLWRQQRLGTIMVVLVLAAMAWLGIDKGIAYVAAVIVSLGGGYLVYDFVSNLRGAAVAGAGPSGSGKPGLGRLLLARRRHFGGMVVHLAMLIIACGLVGSGLFREQAILEMQPGDTTTVGGEQLRFEGVEVAEGVNYSALRGHFVLPASGRVLTPERRFYPVSGMPTTEAAIDSSLARDFYVVFAGKGERGWQVQVYRNPLVELIWLGGAVLVFGVLLALSDRGASRVR